MPHPQALVRFPGINEIVDFSYTLEHGISPGIATITCTPQKGWPAKQGNLVLTFGSMQPIVLRGFVPDSLSFQFDGSGFLWKLRLLDRRVKWRYGEISGLFNKRLPHGPVDQIDPKTEANVTFLMEMLLVAMGEKDPVIAKNHVPKLKPYVFWDYSNPAQELSSLCDLCGMRVVLLPDNRVAVLPKGKGGLGGDLAPTLPSGPIIYDSGTFDPPEKPKGIVFVCGATIAQVDLVCEAVGDDIDGLVKPIDDLTYRPTNGWETGNLVTFRHVPLLPDNANVQDNWFNYCSPRELAKQSIYKKYRITINGPSGKPVTPPGFKKPLTDVRQILPISQQLIEPTFDLKRGWYRPVNNIVWGAFCRGTTNNVETSEVEFKNGQKAVLPVPLIFPRIDPETGQILRAFDSTVIYPDEYSIDAETGIITFSRRFLRFVNNEDPTKMKVMPAVIYIRTAVSVSNNVTHIDRYSSDQEAFGFSCGFTPDRHLFRREMTGGIGKEYAYVRDEDIFVRYSPKKYVRGSGVASGVVESNIETVKKYVKERLDAEERKYQTKGPRHVRYAGWRNISTDGAIMQVSWSMSQTGAFMDASLNDEIAVVTVPYAERRILEKAQSTKADAALDAATKVASEKAFPFSRMSGLTKTGR